MSKNECGAGTDAVLRCECTCGCIAGCDLVCRSRRNGVRLSSSGGTQRQMFEHAAQAALCYALTALLCLLAHRRRLSQQQCSAVALANLDALTQPTSPDAQGSQERNSTRCRMMQGRMRECNSVGHKAESQLPFRSSSPGAPIAIGTFSLRPLSRQRRPIAQVLIQLVTLTLRPAGGLLGLGMRGERVGSSSGGVIM